MAFTGMFSLDGRVALVTGASRGLGLAMAEGLATAGATVVLNGRHLETLEPAADKLRAKGLKADISPFDITDQCAVNASIDSVTARLGRLDILIANAGIQHRAALADWTPEIWDRLIASNLTASFFLAQKASIPMCRQRHGRILFTTSIAGILGRAALHGYAASKSAVAALTRSLAAELGQSGVTCNAISPGYFETEFTAPLLQNETFVAQINSRVPLRRWGKPSDVAGIAVFLASDAASYITAQQIVVDGGFSAVM
jgi:gluconate 5-dehydrogenase